MILARPADLSPGDLIRSPGGEARVTAVERGRSLVRVAFRDRTGDAFVYLRQSSSVQVLDRART